MKFNILRIWLGLQEKIGTGKKKKKGDLRMKEMGNELTLVMFQAQLVCNITL